MSLSTFISTAQISDIAQMASGKIKLFCPVSDIDNNIYGYFSIFFLSRIDKEHQKYEYVLLDKNLNKVANGEFTDIDYKRMNSDFFYPEKIGNAIIISKVYYSLNPSKSLERSYIAHRMLDLEKNELSDQFHYNEGDLIEGYINPDELKSNLKGKDIVEIPLALKDGYVLYPKVKSKNDYDETRYFRGIGMDRKEKWVYDYNPEAANLEPGIERITDTDFIISKREWGGMNSVVIDDIDPSTGKLHFKYELENKKSDYSHLFMIKPGLPVIF